MEGRGRRGRCPPDGPKRVDKAATAGFCDRAGCRTGHPGCFGGMNPALQVVMKSYPQDAPALATKSWGEKLKSEIPALVGIVVVGLLAYLYSLG
jgi:hypothetical protein